MYHQFLTKKDFIKNAKKKKSAFSVDVVEKILSIFLPNCVSEAELLTNYPGNGLAWNQNKSHMKMGTHIIKHSYIFKNCGVITPLHICLF